MLREPCPRTPAIKGRVEFSAGWRNSVVREQVERRGGAEVYAGKGKDRKELKKAHRLEPSREPAIQLPVSHTTAA